ncbi:hypothetical protein [Nevskia ramosa]|uniref:hypothetical protein n=1 Tax=Nevskia ramosa TaxID=64002 RepID=UPI002355D04E|nr:hypothetical protein [Nevskia ramosa]
MAQAGFDPAAGISDSGGPSYIQQVSRGLGGDLNSPQFTDGLGGSGFDGIGFENASYRPGALTTNLARAAGGLFGAGDTVLKTAEGTVVLLGATTGTLLDKTGLFGDYFSTNTQIFDQAYDGVTSFFDQDHPLDSVFASIDSRLAQGSALSNGDSLLDQFDAGRVYGGLGSEGALLVTGGADLVLGAGKLTLGAVQLGRDVRSLGSLNTLDFGLTLDDIGARGPAFDLPRLGSPPPLTGGKAFELESLSSQGLDSNSLVFRPTDADIKSAAFKVIVGDAKYTSSSKPVGTIFDSVDNRLLEIKTGNSVLDSSYQARLQTYRFLQLSNETPGLTFTIQTNRPLNPSFSDYLNRFGVKVEPPPPRR